MYFLSVPMQAAGKRSVLVRLRSCEDIGLDLAVCYIRTRKLQISLNHMQQTCNASISCMNIHLQAAGVPLQGYLYFRLPPVLTIFTWPVQDRNLGHLERARPRSIHCATTVQLNTVLRLLFLVFSAHHYDCDFPFSWRLPRWASAERTALCRLALDQQSCPPTAPNTQTPPSPSAQRSSFIRNSPTQYGPPVFHLARHSFLLIQRSSTSTATRLGWQPPRLQFPSLLAWCSVASARHPQNLLFDSFTPTTSDNIMPRC
jgi:hypothetical protein